MMIDQYRTPTLILGVKNPALVARNEKNRALWESINKEFRRLNDQPHIAHIATAKVMKSLAFVQLASSQAERDDRFRNMSNYQDEVLDLAPADGELIINDFKQSSLLFKAQKRRSKARRVKIGDSELSLRENIKIMISKSQHRDETPWELWPHLYAMFAELGCSPKEILASKRRSVKITYDYPRGKKLRRSITFGRFSGLVTEIRRETAR
jgi:hypothetical protein